jgi:hypothetical protein
MFRYRGRLSHEYIEESHLVSLESYYGTGAGKWASSTAIQCLKWEQPAICKSLLGYYKGSYTFNSLPVSIKPELHYCVDLIERWFQINSITSITLL